MMEELMADMADLRELTDKTTELLDLQAEVYRAGADLLHFWCWASFLVCLILAGWFAMHVARFMRR